MRWACALAVIAACSQRDAAKPGARHPDPIGAAKRCAKAIESSGEMNVADRQRAIVDACAPTIVERACRDAFASTHSPAAGGIAIVMDACTAAYCPQLPAPKPARCTDPNGDIRAFWSAAHTFDLGPEATAILEAAPRDLDLPKPPPLPSQQVSWRVPIVTITPDDVTLDWRAPDGGTERAVAIPFARWDCTPLRDALANEVVKTWPNTVRPTRSKQLLLVADKDATYEIVLKVMKCVEDRTGVRQLYPDVMLSTQ